MMSSDELREELDQLGLIEAEAAELLGVAHRTVARWTAGMQDIPGPAEQAIRAWRKLDDLGLAWRPDSVALYERDPAEIAAHLRHAMGLVDLVERVKTRGLPPSPWVVDLATRRATLGSMMITFYPLANGSFSPASYTRSDRAPDVVRDWQLLEDGVAAFAEAVGRAGKDWAAGPSGRRRR